MPCCCCRWGCAAADQCPAAGQVLTCLKILNSIQQPDLWRKHLCPAAGLILLLCYGTSSAASEAASAAVTALEAAWALTNLAAADHDVAQTVIPAAPALILHLGGGSGMPVAQQAAWALGMLITHDRVKLMHSASPLTTVPLLCLPCLPCMW